MFEQTLFVFNPDHDLALANGNCHYLPPNSALQFANDAAVLPIWLARGGMVLVPYHIKDEDFKFTLQQLNIPASFVLPHQLSTLSISSIQPWGWNHSIRQRLVNEGIDENLLPNNEALSQIRHLSHRALAAEAMTFLKSTSNFGNLFPNPSVSFNKMADIEQFVLNEENVIFKMPWSGSGKGLKRADGFLNDNLRGWLEHSIAKSGCIMGEKRYWVVQDFAMEFECKNQVVFCGYSLFNTKNGAYQENVLLSDDAIRNYLSKWILLQELDEVQQLLQQFLMQKIVPFYQGYVGIDMFVYEENGIFYINPVVEINLRMTMGLLATQFVKHYLLPSQKGRFRVQFSTQKGNLWQEHHQLGQYFPLSIQNGKIKQGYLPLCPITDDTRYTVQVIVN